MTTLPLSRSRIGNNHKTKQNKKIQKCTHCPVACTTETANTVSGAQEDSLWPGWVPQKVIVRAVHGLLPDHKWTPSRWLVDLSRWSSSLSSRDWYPVRDASWRQKICYAGKVAEHFSLFTTPGTCYQHTSLITSPTSQNQSSLLIPHTSCIHPSHIGTNMSPLPLFCLCSREPQMCVFSRFAYSSLSTRGHMVGLPVS